MGKFEILVGTFLGALALGGAAMTQVASAVFPKNERLIFISGLTIAGLALVGLLILFVSARSNKKNPSSTIKQSVVSNNQSGGITGWNVKAPNDE